VLFSTQISPSWWENPRIEVLSLKSNERRILLDEGADARYAGTGHLIFLRQGTLCAVPFDVSRLAVTGPVVQLIENVMQATNANNSELNTFAGQFGFSRAGTVAYIPGGAYPDPARWLFWIERNGNAKPVLPAPGPYFVPRVSPDGKRVVYFTQGKKWEIWVVDIERRISMPLTSGQTDYFPIWTPDSKRVAFTRQERSGRFKIMWMPADGSGEAESLFKSEVEIYASSWSPKGDLLAYLKSDPAIGGLDIWVLRLKDRKSEPFLNTRYLVCFPEFSPDGRWMAYASYETGQVEVYVQPYPGPGQKIRISSEGGWAPCWGPGGRQLYYLNGGRVLDSEKVQVVDIATTPAFSAGPPRLVLDYLGYGLFAAPIRGYDIHPDGQRFLGWGHVYGGKPIRRSDLPEDLLLGLEKGDDRSLVRFGGWLKMDGQRKLSPDWEGLDQKAAVTQIKLVLNWFEELKRLCPAGKK
jgi:Tol biopolymer transport system component